MKHYEQRQRVEIQRDVGTDWEPATAFASSAVRARLGAGARTVDVELAGALLGLYLECVRSRSDRFMLPGAIADHVARVEDLLSVTTDKQSHAATVPLDPVVPSAFRIGAPVRRTRYGLVPCVAGDKADGEVTELYEDEQGRPGAFVMLYSRPRSVERL